MDLGVNNNNNLSFQAKLVPVFRTRHDLMQPVAERFEQLTSRIKGTFYVGGPEPKYTSSENRGLTMNLGGKCKMNFCNSDDIFVPESEVTPEVIDSVAKYFVNQFNALRRYARYMSFCDKDAERLGVTTRLNGYANAGRLSAIDDGDEVLANKYVTLMNKYQKEHAQLETKLNAAADRATEDLKTKYGLGGRVTPPETLPGYSHSQNLHDDYFLKIIDEDMKSLSSMSNAH